MTTDRATALIDTAPASVGPILIAYSLHTTTVELSLGVVADRGARRTAGEGRGVPLVVRSSADRAACLVQALCDWPAGEIVRAGVSEDRPRGSARTTGHCRRCSLRPRTEQWRSPQHCSVPAAMARRRSPTPSAAMTMFVSSSATASCKSRLALRCAHMALRLKVEFVCLMETDAKPSEPESAHTSSRKSPRIPPIELITRGERRRRLRWTPSAGQEPG